MGEILALVAKPHGVHTSKRPVYLTEASAIQKKLFGYDGISKMACSEGLLAYSPISKNISAGILCELM